MVNKKEYFDCTILTTTRWHRLNSKVE